MLNRLALGLLITLLCLNSLPSLAMKIKGKADGLKDTTQLLPFFDFAAAFPEESSSDVSSDEEHTNPPPTDQKNTVIIFSHHNRSTTISIPSTLDEEEDTPTQPLDLPEEPQQEDPEEMYQRGNTLYFVNKNGLIIAKMVGDGEMLNIAHENRYWDDDHSETEDDEATEEYGSD